MSRGLWRAGDRAVVEGFLNRWSYPALFSILQPFFEQIFGKPALPGVFVFQRKDEFVDEIVCLAD